MIDFFPTYIFKQNFDEVASEMLMWQLQ